MYKIPDTPCRKCGGDTSINYISRDDKEFLSGRLFRTCLRCGYSEQIRTLEEENRKEGIKN